MKSYVKCRERVRERKCKKPFLFFFGGCSVLFMDVRSSSTTEIKLRCSQERFKIPLLCHLRVSQLYLSDFLKVIRKVRKWKMINFHPNRHNCTCTYMHFKMFVVVAQAVEQVCSSIPSFSFTPGWQHTNHCYLCTYVSIFIRTNVFSDSII